MNDLTTNILVSTDIITTSQSHENIKLIFVVSGVGYIYIDNIKTEVHKNDYFIVDYGISHKFSTKHSDDFKIITISFTPEFIDHSIYRARNFFELANSYLIRFNYRIFVNPANNIVYHDDDGSIYELFSKSLNEYNSDKYEYNNDNYGFLQFIRCYLVLIILAIMRSLVVARDCKRYHTYVKYINDIVDVNYMEPLKLSDFCKDLNYSLSYLSRRFKEVTNMTFMDFLQMKRIEQSCKLLESTNKKMFEIANLVGYSDMKFFNRTFKKFMKMTPREYKKMVVKIN